MLVAHFYHAYLVGDAWGEIIAQHAQTLTRSGFDGPCIIGALPPPTGAETALAGLQNVWDAADGPPMGIELIDGPWEHQTIELARAYAIAHPDEAVMYCHTKGASAPNEFNAAWRRSMEVATIELWRNNRNALRFTDYDAHGPYWLTPEEWGSQMRNFGEVPYFGGNYWMAKCSYLATLPPPPPEDRFGAERWIGLNDPKVICSIEGWPGPSTFVEGTGEAP